MCVCVADLYIGGVIEASDPLSSSHIKLDGHAAVDT